MRQHVRVTPRSDFHLTAAFPLPDDIEKRTSILRPGCDCAAVLSRFELSKIARDLADVQSKAVDKKLSLEGRPSQITEVRDVADIVRALEAKKVITQIEVESG